MSLIILLMYITIYDVIYKTSDMGTVYVNTLWKTVLPILLC